MGGRYLQVMLKRMDGSLVLNCNFKHPNKIKVNGIECLVTQILIKRKFASCI